jgi:co-chaperonin GroES (HSP10)
MANHFRPLRDRVLLKRVEVEERTPAGIIIQIPPRKNQQKVRFWRSA